MCGSGPGSVAHKLRVVGKDFVFRPPFPHLHPGLWEGLWDSAAVPNLFGTMHLFGERQYIQEGAKLGAGEGWGWGGKCACAPMSPSPPDLTGGGAHSGSDASLEERL